MALHAKLPLRRRVVTFVASTFVVVLTWLLIFSPLTGRKHPLARVESHHVRFHGRQDSDSPSSTPVPRSRTITTAFNTTSSSDIIATSSTTSFSSSSSLSSSLSLSTSISSAISSSSVISTASTSSFSTITSTRLPTSSSSFTTFIPTASTSTSTSTITSISVSSSSSLSSKSSVIDKISSTLLVIPQPTFSASASSVVITLSTSSTTNDPTPSTLFNSVAAKSKGFWGNTTAVAVTFVFVGLIILGIVLAIIITLLKKRRMHRIQQMHANLFETYESEPTVRRSNSIGPSINAAPLDAFNNRENMHIGGNGMYNFSDQGSSYSLSAGHAAGQGQYINSSNGHTSYEDSTSYTGDGASSRETYTTPHPFSFAPMTSRDAPPVTYPRAPVGRTNDSHLSENYNSSLFDSFYGGVEHTP